jgi:GTP-binding protein Era
LIDTPGIQKPDSVLNRQMADELSQAMEGIDVLTLIVDSAAEFGAGDKFAIELIRRFKGPTFLLLNKIDRMRKQMLLPVIDRFRREFDFTEVFPIAAISGDGCEDVVKGWLAHLPEAPALFPPDQFTDQPERFLAAEMVREKVILATKEEVPHAVAVLVDTFSETEKLIRIRATIYVEREGQKGILIGKRGETMKKIGTDARKDLETILGAHIFLELFVKVQPNWRQNPAIVKQLDWHRQLEQIAEDQTDDQTEDQAEDQASDEADAK